MKKLLKKILKPAFSVFENVLPAKLHVMMIHYRAHGCLPNLKCPETFNEKIAYRKLHDRNLAMVPLIDKILVKEQIASRFGKEIIIPTLKIIDDVDGFDMSGIAPPYIIKVNHSCHMNILIKDNSFNEKEIKSLLKRYLAFDHAAVLEEWAYSRIERKAFVEEYIKFGNDDLTEYKFHVFGGKTFALQVLVDRDSVPRIQMYDKDFNIMDVGYSGYPKHLSAVAKPDNFTEMKRIAEEIGKDFSYVRIDLYNVKGKIKFSEATFYPGGGTERFNPPAYDKIFGDQWQV